MNRFFRSALFPLIVIVLLVYLASQTLIPHSKGAPRLTYSQFIQKVDSNNVDTAVFNPPKQSVSFQLKDGKKGTVNYPSEQVVPTLQKDLQRHGVTFDSKGTGSWSWISFLTSLLPFVLLFGFWIFLMNQVQGGGSKVMSFGKSRAKRMAP
ncbi:MAG: ATP-dependent metallopeptidase FtsH/Yme1/Tma family protein, partial [Gaiellaceae bacterium]